MSGTGKYNILILVLLVGCRVVPQKTQALFTDDFSGTLHANWTIENHTFENNLANFSLANVSTANGKLVLKLDKVNDRAKAYTGAEVRSQMKYLYGKFEVRMKATETLGCITAFFLYRPEGKYNHEIDFEISGKYPNIVTLNHWVNQKSHDKDIQLSFNTTTDFHDYTIDWQPKSITWLVDGKVIYTSTEAVPDQPMNVIFNLWATKSEKWAGRITKATLPAFAYIDAVKFSPYQKQQ